MFKKSALALVVSGLFVSASAAGLSDLTTSATTALADVTPVIIGVGALLLGIYAAPMVVRMVKGLMSGR